MVQVTRPAKRILPSLALMLVACSPANQGSETASNDQQSTPAVQPESELMTADLPNPPLAQAESADVAPADWQLGPNDDFLDACLLANFPTGGLVRAGATRTGDFVATVNGDAEGSWEAADGGTRIFRVEKHDRLTGNSDAIAVEFRETRTPPIEDAPCGPRAVVVMAVARNGERANPMQLYAAVRQMAGQAQRARESGALGVLNYREPTPTSGDGPFTERIVSEQSAANRGIALEMGLAR